MRTRLVVESLAAVVVAPVLFMGFYPSRFTVVLWLASIGALAGGSHYCLHRASEHLTQAWRDLSQYTPALFRPIRRWSFWVSDYEPEARNWYWACWALFFLAVGAWVLGNLHFG